MKAAMTVSFEALLSFVSLVMGGIITFIIKRQGDLASEQKEIKDNYINRFELLQNSINALEIRLNEKLAPLPVVARDVAYLNDSVATFQAELRDHLKGHK